MRRGEREVQTNEAKTPSRIYKLKKKIVDWTDSKRWFIAQMVDWGHARKSQSSEWKARLEGVHYASEKIEVFVF